MATDVLPKLKVPELSALEVGREAVCFAALKMKERKYSKYGSPYWTCVFCDRFGSREIKVWNSDQAFDDLESLSEFDPCRLRVRAKSSQRGVELTILEVRSVDPAIDAAEGYRYDEIVDTTHRSPDDLWSKLNENIQRCIDDEPLRRLVLLVLESNREEFCRMQAASQLHHSYTGGLLEHVWSMARVAGFLAEHYAKYYYQLNPPLNRSLIVAAAVLHDIGKLRELKYHPIEARYTKEGHLLGHILMGRDMVRDAARQIGDFPEETLLLLEHAILAHHGKREFGAPVLPQTLEALIVSMVDDLDAKVNTVARELMKVDGGDGEFTDKLFALDYRRMYRGIPVEFPNAPPESGPADGHA